MKKKIFGLLPIYETKSELTGQKIDDISIERKMSYLRGYVVLYYLQGNICFDVYNIDETKPNYRKAQKYHFIYNSSSTKKFYVFENMTNKEIKKEIHFSLSMIESSLIEKQYYLDTSSINNILDYLDIKNMIHGMKL